MNVEPSYQWFYSSDESFLFLEVLKMIKIKVKFILYLFMVTMICQTRKNPWLFSFLK